MELLVLGSGSSGNAIVVRHEKTVLLIDAGLSAKQLIQRLEQIGIHPCELTAILLTHEHGDHARGLQVFCKKHPVPVYANLFTKEALSESVNSVRQWQLIQTGVSFHIRDLEIECFPVPHDAADPVGYTIASPQKNTKIGILNDIGHVTHLVRDRLQGVQALYVEANYDDHLLEIDTKRPWATKQRISSRHGHLSNHQASELVEWLAPHGLKHVILGHLSRDCNQPEIALNAIRQAFLRCELDHGTLWCASQDSPTEWLKVNPASDQQIDLSDSSDPSEIRTDAHVLETTVTSSLEIEITHQMLDSQQQTSTLSIYEGSLKTTRKSRVNEEAATDSWQLPLF